MDCLQTTQQYIRSQEGYQGVLKKKNFGKPPLQRHNDALTNRCHHIVIKTSKNIKVSIALALP